MRARTRLLRIYVLILSVVCMIIHGKGFSASGKSCFEVDFDAAGITSLKLLSDNHNTNFVAEGKTLDNVVVHGLTAGVEAACTVVLDDPIFGLFAYGGSLTAKDNRVSVICHDGVRQRLYFIKGNIRFHLSLNRDGFAKDAPVVFSDDLSTIKFSLENRSKKTHTTELTLFGLPSGSCTVLADDKIVQTIQIDEKGKTVLKIPVSVKAKPVYVILKKE